MAASGPMAVLRGLSTRMGPSIVLPAPLPADADASTGVKAYTVVVFVLTWLLIVRARWPWFPLGRSGATVLGSALVVVGGILPFDEALTTIGEQFEVVVLLWSLMVLSVYLQRLLLHVWVERALTWRCRHGLDLLARLVLLSGLTAALVSDNSVCLFLAPVVQRLTRKYSLPPAPFLIGTGVAATVGGAATLIGNPQVLLVGYLGDLRFGDYAKYMVAPAVTGLVLTWMVVYAVYHRQFHEHASGLFRIYGSGGLYSGDDLREPGEWAVDPLASSNGDHGLSLGRPRGDAATLMVGGTLPLDDNAEGLRVLLSPSLVDTTAAGDEGWFGACSRHATSCWTATDAAVARAVQSRWARRLAYILTVLGVVGMFAAFVAGVPLGLAAVAAAIGVAAVHAAVQHTETAKVLRAVDYVLLLFFIGLFVVVEGLQRTGYPDAVKDAIFGGLDMASVGGLMVFLVVAAVAVNLLSGGPAVLLLAPVVDSLPPSLQFRYWLMLAWVATAASTLTFVGASGTMILIEHALRHGTYHLTMREYARFSIYATLVFVTAGAVMLGLMLWS